MSSQQQHGEYDLVICGGGTAGCVLAARLTEDPNLHVLLLEAGANANDDPRVTVPGLFGALYGDADRDWAYMSEPSLGLNNRQLDHPRGKCLGGSSAMNLMALVYPSQSGLNAWKDLGNPGWGWEGMAPYFRKFQTHVFPSKEVQEILGIDYLDGEFTGTDGPIKASFPKTVHPLQKAWIETWRKLRGKTGNPIDGVGNGGFTTAASLDVEKGVRSFAGTEYLGLCEGRGNLEVVTGALVEKINLEKQEDGFRATGVNFSRDGQSFTARARKEVILAAGVFNSPQLLELSGIGSPSLLHSLGIEALIPNANVGENLQDHLMCGPSYEVRHDITTNDIFRDPAAITTAMAEYQTSKSGPLVSGAGYSFAYTPLVDFITPNPKATLQTLLGTHLPPPQLQSKCENFIARTILSPDETSAVMCFVPVQFHASRTTTLEKLTLTEPENFVTLATQLAHPFSRGSSHITSSSPRAPPKIDGNYLSHPLDAEILGRHILQCDMVASTEPFRSLLKPGGRRLPDGQGLRTLEEAIAFGRANATSNYHPSGTCAMMPREEGGVLNERLIVYGTTNLRVVDASIFPIEPRGNIQSVVYATAEKGADLIKEDLGSGSK